MISSTPPEGSAPPPKQTDRLVLDAHNPSPSDCSSVEPPAKRQKKNTDNEAFHTSQNGSNVTPEIEAPTATRGRAFNDFQTATNDAPQRDQIRGLDTTQDNLNTNSNSGLLNSSSVMNTHDKHLEESTSPVPRMYTEFLCVNQLTGEKQYIPELAANSNREFFELMRRKPVSYKETGQPTLNPLSKQCNTQDYPSPPGKPAAIIPASQPSQPIDLLYIFTPPPYPHSSTKENNPLQCSSEINVQKIQSKEMGKTEIHITKTPDKEEEEEEEKEKELPKASNNTEKCKTEKTQHHEIEANSANDGPIKQQSEEKSQKSSAESKLKIQPEQKEIITDTQVRTENISVQRNNDHTQGIKINNDATSAGNVLTKNQCVEPAQSSLETANKTIHKEQPKTITRPEVCNTNPQQIETKATRPDQATKVKDTIIPQGTAGTKQAPCIKTHNTTTEQTSPKIVSSPKQKQNIISTSGKYTQAKHMPVPYTATLKTSKTNDKTDQNKNTIYSPPLLVHSSPLQNAQQPQAKVQLIQKSNTSNVQAGTHILNAKEQPHIHHNYNQVSQLPNAKLQHPQGTNTTPNPYPAIQRQAPIMISNKMQSFYPKPVPVLAPVGVTNAIKQNGAQSISLLLPSNDNQKAYQILNCTVNSVVDVQLKQQNGTTYTQQNTIGAVPPPMGVQKPNVVSGPIPTHNVPSCLPMPVGANIQQNQAPQIKVPNNPQNANLIQMQQNWKQQYPLYFPSKDANTQGKVQTKTSQTHGDTIGAKQIPQAASNFTYLTTPYHDQHTQHNLKDLQQFQNPTKEKNEHLEQVTKRQGLSLSAPPQPQMNTILSQPYSRPSPLLQLPQHMQVGTNILSSKVNPTQMASHIYDSKKPINNIFKEGEVKQPPLSQLLSQQPESQEKAQPTLDQLFKTQASIAPQAAHIQQKAPINEGTQIIETNGKQQKVLQSSCSPQCKRKEQQNNADAIYIDLTDDDPEQNVPLDRAQAPPKADNPQKKSQMSVSLPIECEEKTNQSPPNKQSNQTQTQSKPNLSPQKMDTTIQEGLKGQVTTENKQITTKAPQNITAEVKQQKTKPHTSVMPDPTINSPQPTADQQRGPIKLVSSSDEKDKPNQKKQNDNVVEKDDRQQTPVKKSTIQDEGQGELNTNTASRKISKSERDKCIEDIKSHFEKKDNIQQQQQQEVSSSVNKTYTLPKTHTAQQQTSIPSVPQQGQQKPPQFISQVTKLQPKSWTTNEVKTREQQVPSLMDVSPDEDHIHHKTNTNGLQPLRSKIIQFSARINDKVQQNTISKQEPDIFISQSSKHKKHHKDEPSQNKSLDDLRQQYAQPPAKKVQLAFKTSPDSMNKPQINLSGMGAHKNENQQPLPQKPTKDGADNQNQMTVPSLYNDTEQTASTGAPRVTDNRIPTRCAYKSQGGSKTKASVIHNKIQIEETNRNQDQRTYGRIRPIELQQTTPASEPPYKEIQASRNLIPKGTPDIYHTDNERKTHNLMADEMTHDKKHSNHYASHSSNGREGPTSEKSGCKSITEMFNKGLDRGKHHKHHKHHEHHEDHKTNK